MKSAIQISGLMIFMIFFSCEGNQSIQKDALTGAYSRGNGITCDDVVIEINGVRETRTEFVYGERVNFVFNNVVGFEKQSDKVFPEIAITVIRNESDTLIDTDNLLKDFPDGTDLHPLELSAHFDVGFVFETTDEFMAQVNITDTKGDGTFYYELPFTIIENQVLEIEENQLSYTNIYLWNESQKTVIAKNIIPAADTVLLLIEGLDGFKEEDGNIFPICKIEFIASNGEKIIDDSNLLASYESIGIVSEELRKGQLPIILTFVEGVYFNPYSLNVELTDKLGSGSIKITSKLNLE